MVTLRTGVRLDTRIVNLIADAAKAAGIDPTAPVVVKGSYVPADSLSGNTHAGGGAFDLRVWNLPSTRIEPFIVELRRRNVCAWLRNQEHGGFDPHIHGIVRDVADLSSGARWQVQSYDRGMDGLTREGKDYHPRPTQRRWPWATTSKPVVTWEKLKSGDRKSNLLVAQALNRLPGDRFSAPLTGRFDDVKGPFQKYRLSTLSPTSTAALRRLAKLYGLWVTP